jgi:hypothetical protein
MNLNLKQFATALAVTVMRGAAVQAAAAVMAAVVATTVAAAVSVVALLCSRLWKP